MKVVNALFALALASLVATPASAATKMVIGYTPSTDVAPLFAAKEEGIFAKHGLDVTLVAGNGSIMIAGLSSGSMQIGNPTATTLLQAIDSGIDLVAVAGGNFMDPKVKQFACVIRTGVEIKTAKDFVGKKVAVSTIGAFLHAMFLEWLTKNGVDPKQVKFVEVPFPQMSDVMRQGNVDAALPVDPFVGRMVGAKIGTPNYDFLTAVPAGMPVVLYAARRDWVKANDAAVKAFRASMQEAIEFVKKNRQKANEDITKYIKIPMPVLEKMHTPDLRVELTADEMAKWVKIMKEQDLIKQNLDAGKLLYQ